ncbi:MAG: hypothetical protein GF308_10440 [Candidatus Heimdallarchaeota archaeon]|nr:hypothetical protein [Candidatus Heimdallarchaeota archaeon]
MKTYRYVALTIVITIGLLLLPVHRMQSVSFPIADSPNDCTQVIDEEPVSQGSMPDIDILNLVRNDQQIIMELNGQPQLDPFHIYYIYIVWDEPAGPFINMTLCIGGGFEGETTSNGSYTMLWNSVGVPVFVQDNHGIIDPTASSIIWAVNQSLVQNPANPYSVLSWTLKNVTSTEYWVDAWPDSYWNFNQTTPPPTTTSPPPTSSSPPTDTTSETDLPDTSGIIPGFTMTVVSIGFFVVTITVVIIRRKK